MEEKSSLEKKVVINDKPETGKNKSSSATDKDRENEDAIDSMPCKLN